jgi:hypothetical protein
MRGRGTRKTGVPGVTAASSYVSNYLKLQRLHALRVIHGKYENQEGKAVTNGLMEPMNSNPWRSEASDKMSVRQVENQKGSAENSMERCGIEKWFAPSIYLTVDYRGILAHCCFSNTEAMRCHSRRARAAILPVDNREREIG